jgi:tetratricopeptide (TPR) repeat protein
MEAPPVDSVYVRETVEDAVEAAGLIAHPDGQPDEWRVRPGRMVFITGLALERREALARALCESSQALGTKGVIAPSAPVGFPDFGAIRGLIGELLPLIQSEAPSLVAEHGEALGDLLSRNGRDARGTRIAETITFAVARRISRESHHSALRIDRLARFILEAQSRCPTLRPGLLMVVADLEAWDRPSLRCLYRVARLARPESRLSLVAEGPALGPPLTKPESLKERIHWARRQFLERLYGDPAASNHELGGEGLSTPPGVDLPDEPFPTILLQTGDSLAYQNYERVYQLCDRLLEGVSDGDEEAQVRRVIAIADAQLVDFAAAEAELDQALGVSRSLTFSAHLQYLTGLLKTKRVYELDGALDRYQAGIELLDRLESQTPDSRLERGWLMNGRALVLTLKAKQADPQERDRLLRTAFDLEFQAYALIKDQHSPGAGYLRHNLFANLTFLLEISKRFNEAVDFWKRSLDRYLDTNHTGFRATYGARLGMLLFKAGASEQAITILDEVRELCRAKPDPFYEEKVALAQGYVRFQRGEYPNALAAFRDGARLALELRDEAAHATHLSGQLWCLAAAGDAGEFERLVARLRCLEHAAVIAQRLERAGADPDLRSRLDGAGIKLPVPSPKLPAYIPSVDLEGTPARDLNRYLVSDGGPLREAPGD